MTAVLKLSHRLIFYTGIGATSAIVHILIVLNLVTYVQLNPLLANVFAFLIAFNISFLGHKYLTFSRLQDQKELSLPHFFLVAASAGILNESLYFLLLRFTQLNYLIALILVLGLVAVYSYLLSRFWACR
ncbi:GtrA family protein [Legionella bononiensis]|uniref:GtrA family protein n=1 Tax=Legionella bononiensis TaxID=2793102 RepID=A0ABS1W6P5_9GAMM|nr:GtrA family protein [Legionella bononiensis]MBL7478408.1 GtrA family protein [Legionella bononiensis]MBL7525005.1 GtrA family protein [Legionella bononiensis]MBL7561302.1 GtrA family protein [Legionella bononiensis]